MTEPNLLSSLAGFALYFMIAVVMIKLLLWAYEKLTPYDEGALITENNIAAAISYTGAKIGLAIPMAFACFQSVGIFDFIIWSLVAFAAQMTLFGVTVFARPLLISQIKVGHVAGALRLAGSSVAVGLLNAAAMSY
ncbi:DUF350 domain-containing protein [Loktanella sp. DJP18]|uniref:DUF350 domain-containing protein n=1 Tax=Loktanella sp. DJP18 TaxID=3409788 RepID=UPI003BB5F484